jgi:hypothetical protein
MEQLVAKIVAPTISVGLAELKLTRTAIMVAGIKVIQEVFSARKVHIPSEASLRPPFNFCSSCMAFNPKGVAAEPKPRMLADRFMMMAPRAA